MGPGAHKARGVPGKKSYYLRQFVCEATGSGLGLTQTIIVSVDRRLFNPIRTFFEVIEFPFLYCGMQV